MADTSSNVFSDTSTAVNHTHRVLIVEDNEDLRKIFSIVFTSHAFEVDLAEDGLQAIERLHDQTPDVVILDINMPNLSGLEVLSFIRSNEATRRAKVIVVTGNVLASQSEEIAQADLFLIKPVTVEDLITLSQRLLARPARD